MILLQQCVCYELVSTTPTDTDSPCPLDRNDIIIISLYIIKGRCIAIGRSPHYNTRTRPITTLLVIPHCENQTTDSTHLCCASCYSTAGKCLSKWKITSPNWSHVAALLLGDQEKKRKLKCSSGIIMEPFDFDTALVRAYQSNALDA